MSSNRYISHTELNRMFAVLLLAITLAGCASSGQRAPVYERAEAEKNAALANKSSQEKDWRPNSYIVQKGDTLFSIAFNYGFDYHELAEMNGIRDPSVITIGQEIHIRPGKGATTARTAVKPIEVLVKDQPKLVKYPYSAAAMAQIDKVQEQRTPATTAIVAATAKPEAKADNSGGDSDEAAEEAALDWALPTRGKVITQFSESANIKGIDIAGNLGQPVLASASGKVVYSGSGLRGYGKLIIIKHNNTYLSAYAHNNKLLVKEGQAVARGQKIAEMGKTDSREVKLHFEVRRFGKPVDPKKYLPPGLS